MSRARAVLRLLVRLLLAACFALPAAADPVQALSLEDWIQRALPGHPAIRQADIDLLYRIRRAEQPGSWEDPALRLGRESRQDRGDQTEVRLRVPVPNPWLAASRRDQLRAEQELAANGRQLALAQAYGELKIRYLEALHKQEQLSAARRLASRIGEERDSAQRMRGESLITEADWLEIRADAAEAVFRCSDAQRQSDEAMARLRVEGALPMEAALVLDGAALPGGAGTAEIPDMSDLQREALADNPAVNRLALIRELEKSVASEDRARGRPSIDYIQGSWTREAERQRDDWEVAVQFVLPVFSLFRQRAVAHARLDRAESEEALQRELIVHALRIAHTRATAARDDLARKSAEADGLIDGIDSLLQGGGLDDPESRIRQWKNRYRLEREVLKARFELAGTLVDLEALRGLNQPGLVIGHLTQTQNPE